jgi:hypothetical protein
MCEVGGGEGVGKEYWRWIMWESEGIGGFGKGKMWWKRVETSEPREWRWLLRLGEIGWD